MTATARRKEFSQAVSGSFGKFGEWFAEPGVFWFAVKFGDGSLSQAFTGSL